MFIKKPIIIANWKMNNILFKRNLNFIKFIIKNKKILNNLKIIISPSFLYLKELIENFKNNKLEFAAQNCCYKLKGSFTGEISIIDLYNIGVKYIIIGHSERRKLFFENDFEIYKKVLLTLRNNMIPILCCGEIIENCKIDKIVDYIFKQLMSIFRKLNINDIRKLIIAYEPSFAICSNKSVDSKIINNIFKKIRYFIKNKFDKKTSNLITINYGGSVNNKNINYYLNEKNIDGVLIGNSSLNMYKFLLLLQNIKIFKK